MSVCPLLYHECADQGVALLGLWCAAHGVSNLQGQERLVRRADMLEGLVSATVNAMGSDP